MSEGVSTGEVVPALLSLVLAFAEQLHALPDSVEHLQTKVHPTFMAASTSLMVMRCSSSTTKMRSSRSNTSRDSCTAQE